MRKKNFTSMELLVIAVVLLALLFLLVPRRPVPMDPENLMQLSGMLGSISYDFERVYPNHQSLKLAMPGPDGSNKTTKIHYNFIEEGLCDQFRPDCYEISTGEDSYIIYRMGEVCQHDWKGEVLDPNEAMKAAAILFNLYVPKILEQHGYSTDQYERIDFFVKTLQVLFDCLQESETLILHKADPRVTALYFYSKDHGGPSSQIHFYKSKFRLEWLEKEGFTKLPSSPRIDEIVEVWEKEMN